MFESFLGIDVGLLFFLSFPDFYSGILIYSRVKKVPDIHHFSLVSRVSRLCLSFPSSLYEHSCLYWTLCLWIHQMLQNVTTSVLLLHSHYVFQCFLGTRSKKRFYSSFGSIDSIFHHRFQDKCPSIISLTWYFSSISICLLCYCPHLICISRSATAAVMWGEWFTVFKFLTLNVDICSILLHLSYFVLGIGLSWLFKHCSRSSNLNRMHPFFLSVKGDVLWTYDLKYNNGNNSLPIYVYICM